MYAVLAVRPVSEYVVAVLAVFDCIIDHVVPLSVDLSILYPVIADPPLFDGVVHERLICEEEIVVVVREVGALGTVTVVTLCVVAEDVFDGVLVPTLLIADTL